MVFGVVSRWGKYHSLIRISLVRLPGYPVYSVYSIPCCMSCGSGLWVTLLVVHGAVPISKRPQFWYIQRQTRSVSFKKAWASLFRFVNCSFLSSKILVERMLLWWHILQICWSIMKYYAALDVGWPTVDSRIDDQNPPWNTTGTSEESVTNLWV